MQRAERKAAADAWRERKVTPGIYALHCPAAARHWVGRAPDLSTIWNPMAFTLRQGAKPHGSLREACGTHGAEAFRFEVLEALPSDLSADDRDRALKARLAHWAATLGAEPI